MKAKLVSSALTGLLLSACAMAPEAAPKLEGTRWQLSAADGGDLAKLAASSGVTLEFAADRVSGNSGCNQYSASYTLKENVLTVGPVGATKRGCADDATTVERAWFATLSRPLTLSAATDTLELRSEGVVLRFVPGAAAPK